MRDRNIAAAPLTGFVYSTICRVVFRSFLKKNPSYATSMWRVRLWYSRAFLSSAISAVTSAEVRPCARMVLAGSAAAICCGVQDRAV